MTEKEQHVLVRYRLEQAWAALEESRILFSSSTAGTGVVNRAYYAMFYATLALLQNIGKAPRKHAGVIALFDQEFVRTGTFSKEMSKFLHWAFELRQASDYHFVEPVNHEQAEEIIENARVFVQTVDAYLKQLFTHNH